MWKAFSMQVGWYQQSWRQSEPERCRQHLIQLQQTVNPLFTHTPTHRYTHTYTNTHKTRTTISLQARWLEQGWRSQYHERFNSAWSNSCRVYISSLSLTPPPPPPPPQTLPLHTHICTQIHSQKTNYTIPASWMMTADLKISTASRVSTVPEPTPADCICPLLSLSYTHTPPPPPPPPSLPTHTHTYTHAHTHEQKTSQTTFFLQSGWWQQTWRFW